MIHQLGGCVHLPRTRAVLRGLAAVAVWVLSAVDALASAIVGVPPFAWCTRRAVSTLRAVYLSGRYGPASESTDVELHVIDAEIIDDKEAGR